MHQIPLGLCVCVCVMTLSLEQQLNRGTKATTFTLKCTLRDLMVDLVDVEPFEMQ